MKYLFLRWGILLALTGVVLGALGAHALERLLSEDQLTSFQTAVRYQMHHALGLMLVAVLFPLLKKDRLVDYAGYLLIVGTLLFSGSIYLLSCRDLLGIANWSWLGPITPLGGACMILGWGLLMIAAMKK